MRNGTRNTAELIYDTIVQNHKLFSLYNMISLYKVVRACSSALFCARFSESSVWFRDLTGADLYGLLLFCRIREQKRSNAAVRCINTHAHAGSGIRGVCKMLEIICPPRTFFYFHRRSSKGHRDCAGILPSYMTTAIHGERSGSTRKSGSNAVRGGSAHAGVYRFTVFAVKRYPSHVFRPCPPEQFRARSTLCFSHFIVHCTTRTCILTVKR